MPMIDTKPYFELNGKDLSAFIKEMQVVRGVGMEIVFVGDINIRIGHGENVKFVYSFSENEYKFSGNGIFKGYAVQYAEGKTNSKVSIEVIEKELTCIE